MNINLKLEEKNVSIIIDDKTFEYNLGDIEAYNIFDTGIHAQKPYDILYKQDDVATKLILVYSDGNCDVKIGIGGPRTLYKQLITTYKICKGYKLDKDVFSVDVKGYIYNPYHLKTGDVTMYLDENNREPIQLQEFGHLLNGLERECLDKVHVEYPIKNMIYKGAPINSNVLIKVEVEGYVCSWSIPYKKWEGYESRKNHIHMQELTVNDEIAILIRRTCGAGSLSILRRPLEAIELSPDFITNEDDGISRLRYIKGCLYRLFHRKPVNVYYEKYGSKADEGAFEVFLEACKSNNSKNYFIITEDSKDYGRIKWHPNVVRKFSKEYYDVIYKTSNFIGTEAPEHAHVLRTKNRWIKRLTIERPFYFLQHGVTYMKAHEKNSPFVKGVSAEPTVIFVGSKKEKNVVHEMLEVPRNNILVTGLPVFSTLTWGHMGKNSKDIAIIMLTWKPYEESVEDVKETSYYQNTMEIFEDLKKYLPEENIRVIAHPKMNNMLKGSDFEKYLWKGEIKEALASAKLLITDYSSVCYNSFYQGGGVVFYHKDKKYYEKMNGKLIPTYKELIGKRVYTLEDLDKVLAEGIRDEKIDLDYFREEKYLNRYIKINKFNDGKNAERIAEELKKRKII